MLTIVHTDFHRGWGGQINRVMTECRGLAQRGHRVVLAVPRGGRPAERAKSEPFELFDAVDFLKAKHVRHLMHDVHALARLLREIEPDVVHSHGSQDTWALAAARRLLPRGRRPAHLLTRHNTKKVRWSSANRWLYGRALTRLIVVAEEVLERYEPFLKAGVLRREDVAVVPSPLRPDLLAEIEAGPPDRRALRAELGLADDDLLIGTAARLVPDKGQQYLLEAAAEVLRDFPGVRVVLAGDGNDEAMLRELAGRLEIAERVHFLGYRQDVAHVLAGLDVAVLPSVDCDASSGMLKEALALEVPCVATEIGAAREILGGAKYGLVVPPRNAAALGVGIAKMLSELPKWRELAVEGGRHVRETYTVDALIDAYEDIYRAHASQSE